MFSHQLDYTSGRDFCWCWCCINCSGYLQYRQCCCLHEVGFIQQYLKFPVSLSVTKYSKVVFCHRNRDCQPEMAISMGEGGVIDRKFNVMWLDTLISYLIRETGFFFYFHSCFELLKIHVFLKTLTRNITSISNHKTLFKILFKIAVSPLTVIA